jgi:calcineurin-like phosphoesterase family protein
MDMQPITWVAAVDYVEGEDHTIDKPERYDLYEKQIWPCDDQPVLSWYGPDSSTGKTKKVRYVYRRRRKPISTYGHIAGSFTRPTMKEGFYRTMK